MGIAIVPVVRKVEPRKTADYSMEEKNGNSNPELVGPCCSHLQPPHSLPKCMQLEENTQTVLTLLP